MLKLIILLFLSLSCSHYTPVFDQIISEKLRVIEYEPSPSKEGESRYQFEDEKHYYAFRLTPKQQEEAEKRLEKITTSEDQAIVLKYSKYNDTVCFKYLKINDETLEIKSLSLSCGLYVSWLKDKPGFHHKRITRPKLGPNQIKYFLKKNKKFTPFKYHLETQSLQAGLPEKVLLFMWGKPLTRSQPDEDGIILLEYPDWYVSLKDQKVFSFSSREIEEIKPLEPEEDEYLEGEADE